MFYEKTLGITGLSVTIVKDIQALKEWQSKMLHRLRHMKQFIQLSADSIGVAAIRESRGTIGRMANNYVAYAYSI